MISKHKKAKCAAYIAILLKENKEKLFGGTEVSIGDNQGLFRGYPS